MYTVETTRVIRTNKGNAAVIVNNQHIVSRDKQGNYHISNVFNQEAPGYGEDIDISEFLQAWEKWAYDRQKKAEEAQRIEAEKQTAWKMWAAMPENQIIAFRVSRGGRFSNGGYLTFIDMAAIGEFTNDLFLTHQNESKFSSRYGYDSTGNKDQRCIRDLITDGDYYELEEKFGISKSDLGEKCFYTEKGKYTGLTESDYSIGIGRIDIDGEYNTIYTKYAHQCTDRELRAVIDNESNSFVDEDVIQWINEKLNQQ